METEALQKALVFGSASFIGAALVETMRASGYEVEAGHADSDVLAADVVVCNAYGKGTVSTPAPVDLSLAPCHLLRAGNLYRLNCKTPNECCPSW